MERPFLEKVSTRSLRVGIIGLGYVGLPLAVTFAEAGFHVTGIDADLQRVDQANRGESYIPDVSSSTLQKLINTQCICFTVDYNTLDDLHAVSLSVPTPLRNNQHPQLA